MGSLKAKIRKHVKAVDALFVQAIAATVLSFTHIKEIAEAAGQDDWKAWLYPISVDLLLFAGWQRIRAGHQRGAAWCWFLIALGASLGANIGTAGVVDLENVPTWLSVVVGGWPAMAFLGGTLLVHGRPKSVDDEDAEEPAVNDEPDTVEPPTVDVDPEPVSVESGASSDEIMDAIFNGRLGTADDPNAEPAVSVETSTVDATHIVTVSEAAEALGIPASTIRGWASESQGRITHYGYRGRSTLVDLLECRSQMAKS